MIPSGFCALLLARLAARRWATPLYGLSPLHSGQSADWVQGGWLPPQTHQFGVTIPSSGTGRLASGLVDVPMGMGMGISMVPNSKWSLYSAGGVQGKPKRHGWQSCPTLCAMFRISLAPLCFLPTFRLFPRRENTTGARSLQGRLPRASVVLLETVEALLLTFPSCLHETPWPSGRATSSIYFFLTQSDGFSQQMWRETGRQFYSDTCFFGWVSEMVCCCEACYM